MDAQTRGKQFVADVRSQARPVWQKVDLWTSGRLSPENPPELILLLFRKTFARPKRGNHQNPFVLPDPPTRRPQGSPQPASENQELAGMQPAGRATTALFPRILAVGET